MLRIDLRSRTVGFCVCVAVMGAVLCCEPATRAQTISTVEPGTRKQQEVEKGALDPIKAKTDLYPAAADAKKEIAAKLKRAGSEKKRVLLVFGANWCYDCHVLDRALHEGAAGKVVQESFLVVHVDIGEGDKNLELAKKYKIPVEKGVPAVAILDSAGNLLYSSGAGEFESARTMMKKDLVAFLTNWKTHK